MICRGCGYSETEGAAFCQYCGTKFTASVTSSTVAATATSERTENFVKYDVMLTAFGLEKVKVIKAVRELTGLGLAEAKFLVEHAPATLKASATKEEAESMNIVLTNAGATVVVTEV